jgi:hypothetical protein
MADVIFLGQFTASKVGVNGLTVTWDIERLTLADGARSALVTGGATDVVIGRRGLYGYRLSGADLATYLYVATAITGTTTVDSQEVSAIAMVVPDALVSSRSTLTAQQVWEYATRTLTAISDSAGVATLLSIFTGMTSLPKWLRGLFRKDAMDATAKTEINTGGGTFAETTDSLEAIRDAAPFGAELTGAAAAAVVGLATPADVADALTNYGPAVPGDPMTIARR